MLTEVMRHYHLRRPPVDVGFFETDHHQQMTRDLIAAIQGGRLIALTAVIGSGKTALARRLRDSLDKEGRVIVSRSLTLDKAKITVPLLIAALFYDLSTEKTVTISSQSERRAEPSRCVRVCDLADATCDLEAQICDLATRHPEEERYHLACERAELQCDAAIQACERCEE